MYLYLVQYKISGLIKVHTGELTVELLEKARQGIVILYHTDGDKLVKRNSENEWEEVEPYYAD